MFTDAQMLVLFKAPNIIDLLPQRQSVVQASQIIGHKLYTELKNKWIFLKFIKYIGLQNKLKTKEYVLNTKLISDKSEEPRLLGYEQYLLVNRYRHI